MAGSQDDWYIADGPARAGFQTSLNAIRNQLPYGVFVRGTVAGVYGEATPRGPQTPGDKAGVLGSSRDNPGVIGASSNEVGVYGQSGRPGPNFPDPRAGVSGTAQDAIGVVGTSSNGIGVIGMSPNSLGVFGISFESDGVAATSNSGRGVFGESLDAEGVYGLSSSRAGVVGVSNQSGPDLPFINVSAGVWGTSQDNIGTVGTSTNQPGVIGFSANSHGVFGQSANPKAYAGFFQGNLLVTGEIIAGIKDAIVPFPDGSKRLLHCMESPEHWFEDFGSARLARGRVTVKLDADFTKVVKLSDYRVFLTPEGDCQGLYVRSKRGKSFEVRELQGGASSVAFSYRIVARRRDIKEHQRFAKIDTSIAMPTRKQRAARGRKATRSFPRALLAALEKHARKRTKKPA